MDAANGTAVARTRRMSVPDPLWSQQWYLQGTKNNDINVQPAWDKGYSGHGVVVRPTTCLLLSSHIES